MESGSNKINNLNKNNKENLLIKIRKKPKGWSKFLRNVIKDKTKVMKEVIKNRFYKWRKNALKGKIKKTMMIRISISREKDPKVKHQIGKVRPKEQSRSVNKNDFQKFNINNIPQNLPNIKRQKVESIEKEDKNINIKNNEKKNINQNKQKINNENRIILKNKENKIDKDKIYKKVDVNNKNDTQLPKDSRNRKTKEETKNNKYEQNKLNNKKDEPKINQKNNNINKVYRANIPKPNINRDKNKPNDSNKTPILNNTIVYTSSSKKNNQNEKKSSSYSKNITPNNNSKNQNQNKSKNTIPKDYYKKYEGIKSSPKIVKIDLNNERPSRRTFNGHNNDYLYENLSYKKDIPQNKIIYNNNTYKRYNNNNNDNRSIYNYSVKTENYNNEPYSSYSYSRKQSELTYGPINGKRDLKDGITTVIQHYSGRRRKVENYDKTFNEAYIKKK